MFSGFRQFILRGNVLDLAVAPGLRRAQRPLRTAATCPGSSAKGSPPGSNNHP